MRLIETRGNDGVKPNSVKFSEAILNPLASFGGLYVPESLPDFGEEFLNKHINSNYKELAKDVLQSFNIDIDDELIDSALSRYDHFDDPSNPVPVVKIDENTYITELYHGPTRAFKDMALQPFGVILSKLAQDRGENYLILAATSGDTGPATLETFKNKDNIKVVCLYPDGGTSDVQRLQMVTEDAPNLKVLGVVGNFDDTQNALKEMLGSEDFKNSLTKNNIKLSAANSVNFGRIIFQTIYHIYSYLELVRVGRIKVGDKIKLIVPSGNFGNALGGYYVKKAGVPIDKIVIASNDNNILTELINNGKYDLRGKKLIKTNSPAMDILKSSNVERILFDKLGSKRTKELMDSLNTNDYYELSKDELEKIQEDFEATYSDENEVKSIIKKTLNNKKYLMDPHTATNFKCILEKNENMLPIVAYSTAEWTKFSSTIANILDIQAENDKIALNMISEKYNVRIPRNISEIFKKEVTHLQVIEKSDIIPNVIDFLKS